MSECLPDLPRHIRQNGDQWEGANHQNGPWWPNSAAIAHELATILRERHGGSSSVADWLDGVGAHS